MKEIKNIAVLGAGAMGVQIGALAAEAVWTLPPDRFPDGIISHNFSSQPQADVALENIARTFGEEPEPTPTLASQ